MEHPAVLLLLPQNRKPGEPRLLPLKAEQREKLSVIMHGAAPPRVVVGKSERIALPPGCAEAPHLSLIRQLFLLCVMLS